MKMNCEQGIITNLYETDEYITKNSSLHAEDSDWKVKKIIPLIDEYISIDRRNEITLLDVGGGAGLILDRISTYLQKKHDVKVNKFSLDLSPGMLDAQKKSNPDLKSALNEDIRNTSLNDKQIDLTLMIDTLEHIPDPAKALRELKRISRFVIFKVPLDNNIKLNFFNLITGGKQRQEDITIVGHVNFYDLSSLKSQIQDNFGVIQGYYFTNVHDYYCKSCLYNSRKSTFKKLINHAGNLLYHVSPALCSYIFGDFIMLLVKY